MIAIVACFYDVVVVRKLVEQCCRRHCIAKHTGPFSEAQIGGDDAGAFIELAEQMERRCTAGLADGQIAELAQHHEIGR